MSRQKSWQRRRRPVSVIAEMALRKEKVAARLFELREAHGLTQEQAAAKVGVTIRQWQRWESGESTPYPRNLDAVASRFGMSISEFFDEELAPPSGDAVALAAIAEGQERIEALLEKIWGRLASDDDAALALASDVVERLRSERPTRSEDAAEDAIAAHAQSKPQRQPRSGQAGSRSG